jgi:hypothetical protein
MKKTTTYTVSVILILLAAGAVWWVWSMGSRPQVQVQTPEQPAAVTSKTFEAPGKFTIAYPQGYQVTTGTGLGGSNLETSDVLISLPDSLLATSGTNYAESYLVVSESSSSTVVHDCLNFNEVYDHQMSGATSTKIINGVPFSEYLTEGVGAGQLYDGRVWRTVYEGSCYEVLEIVHTGNIGMYDPPVQEFDKQPAWDKLDAIFNTIRFE